MELICIGPFMLSQEMYLVYCIQYCANTIQDIYKILDNKYFLHHSFSPIPKNSSSTAFATGTAASEPPPPSSTKTVTDI